MTDKAHLEKHSSRMYQRCGSSPLMTRIYQAQNNESLEEEWFVDFAFDLVGSAHQPGAHYGPFTKQQAKAFHRILHTFQDVTIQRIQALQESDTSKQPLVRVEVYSCVDCGNFVSEEGQSCFRHFI